MEKKTFVQSTLHGNGKDVSTEQHSWSLARNRFHNPPGYHDVTVSDANPCQFPPISPSHPSTQQPSRNMCLNGKMHVFANATMGVLLPRSVGSVSVVKHGYVAGRHSMTGIRTASRWRMRHGIQPSRIGSTGQCLSSGRAPG